MHIAIAGNFGLTGNQTMAARALPIAEALAGQGHVVRMVLPVRRRGDGAPADKPGVEIRYAAGPGAGLLTYLFQIAVLVWLCVRWRPAVVYGFKPIAHSAAVIAFFLLLRRLGMYHGIVALDTDDWEGDGGWNEKQPFPGWLKRLVSWQEKWTLRHADVVTAASLELAKLADECGAHKVAYVPNCLAQTPRAASGTGEPSRWPRDGQGPRVLVYTRFVEYRLERLVATFEAILSRIPSATFLVVGTGLNAEEETLKRVVEQRGMSSSVAVAGQWVGDDEKPAYFGAADAALYLMDDNLLNRTKCPVKLLELTAAGVPVVADRVGQSAEYTLDGETGWLVMPGDVEAMAERAASLLTDPSRRSMMSEAAGLRASTHWVWGAWLPQIEGVLGLAETGEHTVSRGSQQT
jgi:glycosyltransferase involved in cell wall biosynthesis